MEYRKQGAGWQTFHEHCGLMVTALIMAASVRMFFFFVNLKGKPWICLFVAAMVLLVSGAAMILYAKIPVYRSGRLLTFGVKSVPEPFRGFYRWGWRVFLFGVALSLCLLLSRP